MSANQSGSPAARFDLYGQIHKALRAFFGETLVAVGRMDTTDDSEVAVTLDQVRTLLDLLAVHLDGENRFVHAAMEARRPGSAQETAHDHVEHELAFVEISRLVAAVQAGDSAGRATAAQQLYSRLALFVADNLAHMAVEERDNAAVLWADYTDRELMDIEGSIVSHVPPVMFGVAMRWMMKALTHDERVGRLRGMQQGAPAGVFEGALAIARSTLGQRDWDRLAAALELPVARAA